MCSLEVFILDVIYRFQTRVNKRLGATVMVLYHFPTERASPSPLSCMQRQVSKGGERGEEYKQEERSVKTN